MQVSLQRVLLSLYYLESALLKVQESGLTQEQMKAVFEDNARLLRRPRSSARSISMRQGFSSSGLPLARDVDRCCRHGRLDCRARSNRGDTGRSG